MKTSRRLADHVIRVDETPRTFAELKPPGYWSATAGRFITVRMINDEEFWERSFALDPDFELADSLPRAVNAGLIERARAM